MDTHRLDCNSISLLCLVFMVEIVGFAVGRLGYHQIFDRVLEDVRYDRRQRPGELTDETTLVHLSMHINDISSVDELNMEFSMDVYLRQLWQDSRLTTELFNGSITLNHECISKIWVPDLFISNSKYGLFHDITVPNILLRIDNDGNIIYSQRLTMRVACSLSLRKYPLDNQTCRVQMESYSMTENQLMFRWPLSRRDAIQIDNDISLPEFALDIPELDIGYCTMYYITGSFSCLYAEIKFKRAIGYYLIQTYVPSVLVVILSWVSFWIDMHAVPARITLGLLTVLTMTTQASAITQTLPRVSYVKAIDIWVAMCLGFVFGALLEYSLVNVLARTEQDKLLKNISHNPKLQNTKNSAVAKLALQSSLSWLARGELSNTVLRATVPPEKTTPNNINEHMENGQSGIEKDNMQSFRDEENINCANNCCIKEIWKKDKALFVDKVSRIVFPGAFVIFNLFYWAIYMHLMH